MLDAVCESAPTPRSIVESGTAHTPSTRLITTIPVWRADRGLSLAALPILSRGRAYLLVIRRVFDVAASFWVPRSRLVETVSCKSFFVVQQGRAREQPRLAQGPEIR